MVTTSGATLDHNNRKQNIISTPIMTIDHNILQTEATLDPTASRNIFLEVGASKDASNNRAFVEVAKNISRLYKCIMAWFGPVCRDVWRMTCLY
jgi:hypothetical protein